MPPSDSNPTLAARLGGAYATLDSDARLVVDALSILYEAVAPTTLLEFVQAVGDGLGPQARWRLKDLARLLDDLEAAGFVEAVGNRIRCVPVFREAATRRVFKEGRFAVMAAAADDALQPDWRTGRQPGARTEEAVLRDFRLGLFLGDPERTYQYYSEFASRFPESMHRKNPYEIVLADPVDPETLRSLPGDTLSDFFFVVLDASVHRLEPAEEAFRFLEGLCRAEGREPPQITKCLLAEQLILRGRAAEAPALVGDFESAGGVALLGWADLVGGDHQTAIRHFQRALGILKSTTRKRKIYFSGPAGLFFILALLETRERARYREAKRYVELVVGDPRHPMYAAYRPLGVLISVLQNEITDPEIAVDILGRPGAPKSLAAALAAARRKGFPARLEEEQDAATDPFETLMQTLTLLGVGTPAVKDMIPDLETICERAESAGYRWLAAEAADLWGRLDVAGHAERAEQLAKETETRPLSSTIEREEPWERSLSALLALGAPSEKKRSSVGESRMVWLVSALGRDCTLRPVEQKRTKKGGWSKGRRVSLKRLQSGSEKMDFLTAQDLKICSCIQSFYQGGGYWDRYGETYFDFEYERALPALVGHPLVFSEEEPTLRVEVIAGEPELLVQKEGRHVTLELLPRVEGDEAVFVERESPTRLRVLEINERHRRLAEILGSGLNVPAEAETRVQEALAGLTSFVTVQSDVGAVVPEAEKVAPDPTLRIQLVPSGPGFRAQVLVRPFGNTGSYYRPGSGGQTVIAEIEGRRIQTQRDLEGEQREAGAVVAACPILATVSEGEHGWVLEDPEDCLDLLVELQALAGRALVEWPEGEKLKSPRLAALEQLKLRVRSDRDWFQAEGELRVDEDLVLDLGKLLELSAETSGRFIALGEGEFLALTQGFRRRLDDLRAFAQPRGKGLRFHPLAAPALEELAGEAGSFHAGRGWKELLGRYHEAQGLEPAVPSTLQTTLRPYQVDGYQWLVRMAHWGVGACLADDMGLGKTLQALALLLTRAPAGPSLVVAPTSVCTNWVAETRRWAPTLRPLVFGGGDRGKMLEALQPFDLVIASYGLLLQEAERLAAIPWETVVLDEAQAIKNFAAKRSQAAMKLDAGFKLITTGTPVENHLGELWNLFRFLNPGLLGSLESFNRRFAMPIERDHNAVAQSRLKKLIQPFIFRRTKSQVLDDLPPRTDILHLVEPSEGEVALYEALRRQALERLAQTDGPPAGHRQLQVLAEIMRLRRACCNARLVLPDSHLASSKLDAFREIVDELLANRHKALVFSQFVDHLTIVREFLDERGVSYQYLDGSTSPRQRKLRIDAFQAGEGDLFLISLKAGGQGLNLTAADYVIHLDPWWNPAVEDQASDRAHRIGQQRPVTVYRLVVKGTIEEKIVELHHQKRNLADGLLEGTDLGGKLSAEELLEVLREA